VLQPQVISADRERSMMVADMTTFMARLVSKLTQTAVQHTNNLIKKTPSQFTRIEPIQLQDSELVEFKSNT
jgi:hypothetical protein